MTAANTADTSCRVATAMESRPRSRSVVDGRGYAWARSAFMALVGVLTIGWFFVLGASSGEDAVTYTSRDLLATTALWLVGLVAMTLIFTQRANPHYQSRAATRAATPANGTGANVA
jgi:uncharacterized membrane protein YfbV (UPF0208 family)